MAKEEAWKVYPKRPEQKCITAFGTFEFDHDAPNREGFIKGYEQSEKDCALTWEDVKLICDLKMELALDDDLPPRSQELYEAVLLAFKQRKEDYK